MKRTKTKDPNIVVYPDGTHYFRRGKKEVSLKTKVYKDALIRKRLLEAKGDIYLTASLKLKFNDIVAEYLSQRKRELDSGKIRVRTFNETNDMLNWYLLPYFGKMSVAKTNSLDWEAFKQTKLPNDKANMRKVFGHMVRWCVKNGYKKDLLLLDIDHVERRQRRILKPHEFEAIWNHSTGSMKLFIALALTSGLRRTEIMTLSWANITFENRAILIPKHISKTKRARWVSVSDTALELLKARLVDQKEKQSAWVFPHRERKNAHAHMDGLKGTWKRTLKRAFNVSDDETLPDIQWHDLRATCEYYAHKRTDLSDTQLEKFFGANVEVQRKIYVSMDADDVRGIENSLLLQSVNPDAGKPRGEKK